MNTSSPRDWSMRSRCYIASTNWFFVTAYFALPSRYCVLRCCIRFSLFVAIWYLPLSAFNLSLIIVSFSVQQGTDYFDVALFDARGVLNVLLHANLKISRNFSINVSMSVSKYTRVNSFYPSLLSLLYLFILKIFFCANRCRFSWNFSMLPFSTIYLTSWKLNSILLPLLWPMAYRMMLWSEQLS
jgi:hypothetical protein